MTEEQSRSLIMKAVKSKNTAPEMLVRKLLFSLGYRYRIHSNKLVGKPDVIFPSRKKVIFINGCFWHGHNCKRGDRLPSSNQTYWSTKIQNNKRRDKNVTDTLRKEGWKVLVVWECELKNISGLQRNLVEFLTED